jgi:phosphoribosylglycinamide formyltransferase-1
MRIRPADNSIGILLSGRGSNFEAIAARIESGFLDARIRIVLGNREDAPGLEHARRRGLHVACVTSKGRRRDDFDREVAGRLRERGVSLVCLAGFMRVLGPELVGAFPWGILNIHPSILPAFPGLDAQRQALEHGAKVSGCTVHFVDASLDGGPIVKQAVVPVLEQDTEEALAARILVEEHRIYSEAIGAVLGGRCETRGRRVVVHEPEV